MQEIPAIYARDSNPARPGSRTFRRGAFTMLVQRRNLELPNRSLKDPDRAFKLSDSASDSGLQNHWQA